MDHTETLLHKDSISRDLKRCLQLFSLDSEFTIENQRAVIEWTRENGHVLPVENKKNKPFWLGSVLTSVDEAQMAHVPEEKRDRWMYQSRLRSDLNWNWKPGLATDLVKEALKPYDHLIEKITRVVVAIQIPGIEIRAHRDFAAGNTYHGMVGKHSTLAGSLELMYEGDEWLPGLQDIKPSDQHKQQKYLSLKIPISEKEEPGRPYVLRDGVKIYYSSENHLFFLNEAEVLHGSEAVDYQRGLILVNGIFDAEAVEKEHLLDIHVREVSL